MTYRTPSSKHARHVQRELAADPSLERPAYLWCLTQVIAHLDVARVQAHQTGEHVDAVLVAMIRELARKAVKP